MDTGTYLRAMWHRRGTVLGRVAVAAVVFGMRAALEDVWTTASQLYLVVGDRTVPGGGPAGGPTGRRRGAPGRRRRGRGGVTGPDPAAWPSRTRRRAAWTSPQARRRRSSRTARAPPPRAVGRCRAGAGGPRARGGRPPGAGGRRPAAQVAALPVEDPRGSCSGPAAAADAARLGVLGQERVRLDVVRRPGRLCGEGAAPGPRRRPGPRARADPGRRGVRPAGGTPAGARGRRRRAAARALDRPARFRVGPGRHGPDEAPAAVRFLHADAPDRPLVVATLSPTPGSAAGCTGSSASSRRAARGSPGSTSGPGPP